MAVAGGAAFTFCYTETVELLTAAGADVVTVDPLRDEALPPGTGALVLGGGFPEVHAGDLSANEPLRADVARLAGSGAPVVAECAGLLYLASELDGLPMCGVLDATARMTPRLTLGYRDAVAAGASVLAPAGTAVRGHEFHRTTVVPGSPRGPRMVVRRQSTKASSAAACTRPTCTCTGPGIRARRGASWRRQQWRRRHERADPRGRGHGPW